MVTELNGLPVYYEQSGDHGPNILLLHGWGCSSRTLRPIMNDLSADYRVTALDFPAHGQTPEPPAPWDVHDFARLTAELIRSLGIAPVSVIAHSFGARVAACVAAEEPELVDRLVLTGAAGIKKEQSPEAQRRSAAFKKKRELLDRVASLPGLKAVADRERERLVQKYGSADYKQLTPSMRPTFSKIVGEDLSPLYPKIAAPTLLVFGRDDTETPLWMGERMEKAIPDAGLVVFEGRGHFAFLEEWSRFDTIVRAFIPHQTENT